MLLDPLVKSNFPCSTRFSIPLLRTSSEIQKRRGDKGSPCLTLILHQFSQFPNRFDKRPPQIHQDPEIHPCLD